MDDDPIVASARETFDFHEILNIQARYGETIDRLVSGPGGGASALRQIFSSDAVIDFPGLLGRFEGIAAIEALFGEILPAQLEWMWHSFGSPLIEVEGDRATARWTLYSLVTRKGREGQPPEAVYGRYANSYVRTVAGWRQSSLLFTNETRSASIIGLGAAVRSRLDGAIAPPVAEVDI